MTDCRWRDLVPAALIAMATFAGVAVFTLAPMAQASFDGSRQVAVIFAPWVSVSEGVTRVAKAGGRPVRTGRLQSIIVAQPDDRRFFDDIHDEGALFVVDPTILGGCVALGAFGDPG